jgi:hypothetical protein
MYVIGLIHRIYTIVTIVGLQEFKCFMFIKYYRMLFISTLGNGISYFIVHLFCYTYCVTLCSLHIITGVIGRAHRPDDNQVTVTCGAKTEISVPLSFETVKY